MTIPTQVVLNGNTYSANGSSLPNRDLVGPGGFGHVDYLVPMFSDAMTDMTAKVEAATAQVDLATAQVVLATACQEVAEASALQAFASAGTWSLSNDELTVEVGLKEFYTNTGKEWHRGQSIKIALTATASTWMYGDVMSYDDTTGAISVQVSLVQGADPGPYSGAGAWTLTLAPPGGSAAVGYGGSPVSSAIDIDLDSASGAMMSIEMTAPNRVVRMPDATTLPIGCNVFTLHNSGFTNSFMVVDKDGNPLTVIAAGSRADNTLGQTISFNLPDNSTTAGIWILANQTHRGSLTFPDYLTSGMGIDNTSLSFMKVCRLTATRAVWLHRQSSENFKAKCIDLDGSTMTVGAEATFGDWTTWDADTSYACPSMDRVTDSRLVVAYYDSVSIRGLLLDVATNGTITPRTDVVLVTTGGGSTVFVGSVVGNVIIRALTTTVLVLGFNLSGGSSAMAMVVTVDTNTLVPATADAEVVETGVGFAYKTTLLVTDTAQLLYSFTSVGKKMVVLDVTGTAITASTPVTLDSGTDTSNHAGCMELLDDGTALMVWSRADYTLVAGVVTITASVPAMGTLGVSAVSGGTAVRFPLVLLLPNGTDFVVFGNVSTTGKIMVRGHLAAGVPVFDSVATLETATSSSNFGVPMAPGIMLMSWGGAYGVRGHWKF